MAVWILFVCCALATNIVMLNLLIALISESFGKINSNSMSANYQERARLISENTYLIPSGRLQKLDAEKDSRYIILADETPEVQESLIKEENMDVIKEANKEMEERFMKELSQIKEMLEKITEAQKKP